MIGSGSDRRLLRRQYRRVALDGHRLSGKPLPIIFIHIVREHEAMIFHFDPSSADDYKLFLKVRNCPRYRFSGTSAYVPDEYAERFNVDDVDQPDVAFDPIADHFDYQHDIAETAIRKRKYAVFADCGLGKTMILLEFARHAAKATGKRILIVSPLMVVRQTIAESARWFPDLSIGRVAASDMQQWLSSTEPADAQVGVTNYEAIREAYPSDNLGGIILDESSMLKSHYGAWGTRLIEMGAGLDWKLCCTGTPAPNDRIEFANHAVFLDRARTVNEFLASYFINRGQTQNRWELKPHALGPFYRSLAEWSIFLTNPDTYGWKDNVGTTPPIHIHIDEIDLTPEQRLAAQQLTGDLLTANVGGIGQRGKLSQIAKGKNGMPTNKPSAIKAMVDSWPDESTIIWCHYNDEQTIMEKTFPDAVSVSGSTLEDKRAEAIDAFIAGDVKVLITKPKILGFGLNLQVATRQIFSGIKDSYEEFYQAVKRSNRIGSTKALNVHVPVTELEMPFITNVLRKASRVEADTVEQERLFKEMQDGDHV